jgi:hypothetical protein
LYIVQKGRPYLVDFLKIICCLKLVCIHLMNLDNFFGSKKTSRSETQSQNFKTKNIGLICTLSLRTFLCINTGASVTFTVLAFPTVSINWGWYCLTQDPPPFPSPFNPFLRFQGWPPAWMLRQWLSQHHNINSVIIERNLVVYSDIQMCPHYMYKITKFLVVEPNDICRCRKESV